VIELRNAAGLRVIMDGAPRRRRQEPALETDEAAIDRVRRATMAAAAVADVDKQRSMNCDAFYNRATQL
jgi:hypothetical protein